LWQNSISGLGLIMFGGVLGPCRTGFAGLRCLATSFRCLGGLPLRVSIGQRVFLRYCSFRSCQGFDELFKQVSHPHLCNNLAQEHAYVQNAWKSLSSNDGSSSSSSPSLFSQKHKATFPLNSFPSPVKHECLLLTLLRDLSPTFSTRSTSVTPIANSTSCQQLLPLVVALLRT
jgi:hypothetical protein